MSDSDTSDISINSNASTIILERNNNLDNSTSDIENGNEINSAYMTLRRDENLIRISKRDFSKILKINSPEYNLILNNQIRFSFDTPIGTPNCEEPTLDLMERLMERLAWSSSLYQEHTGAGTLRNMPIYSGTIHQVALWSCEKMPAPCLFEITAQVVGIAQRDPSLPNCKGNEINLLIRDLVKRDPVIQVIQPYYLRSQLPIIVVGQMIRCVGVMMDTHQMQALKVTIASYVDK